MGPGGKGEGIRAYDPDLKVGGEAAEDGALRRSGVLLRLGRHRRRAAAMRPESTWDGMGWLGFLVGKRRGGDAVAAGVKWERRRGSAATTLGCEICGPVFLRWV